MINTSKSNFHLAETVGASNSSPSNFSKTLDFLLVSSSDQKLWDFRLAPSSPWFLPLWTLLKSLPHHPPILQFLQSQQPISWFPRWSCRRCHQLVFCLKNMLRHIWDRTQNSSSFTPSGKWKLWIGNKSTLTRSRNRGGEYASLLGSTHLSWRRSSKKAKSRNVVPPVLRITTIVSEEFAIESGLIKENLC